MLKKIVNKGSIILTDGYPSYPYVVNLFGSVHKVVNHTTGFNKRRGYNSNKIENVWSHLRPCIEQDMD
jgi:hypothetical protein